VSNNRERVRLENDISPDDLNLHSADIFYVDFPKKYQRKFADSFDKRFTIILIFTFIFHFSTAFYFSNRPIVEVIEPIEIARIQEQFARLVLKKEVVKPEKTEIEETYSSNEDFSRGETTEAPAQLDREKSMGEETAVQVAESGGSEETARSRSSTSTEKYSPSHYSTPSRLSTNQYSEAVRNKGLLGLLTSSSKSSKEEGVENILGSAAKSQGKLSNVLNNVDEIRKDGGAPGSGSRQLRGNRAQGEQGTENIISGREKAISRDIKRQSQREKDKVSEIRQEQGVVSGKRNPDEISEVVTQHNGAIQSCYQRELRRNPELKGKVVVRFTISPAGLVKNVQLISSTLNNARVERCIISRVRRWDDFGAIDPTQGDTSFRQVYTFGY